MADEAQTPQDGPDPSVADGSELIQGGPDSAADRTPADDIATAISHQLDAEKRAGEKKSAKDRLDQQARGEARDQGDEGGSQRRQPPGSAKPIPQTQAQKQAQGQPPQGQRQQQSQQTQVPNAVNQDGSVTVGGKRYQSLDHVAQVLHTQSERAAAESRQKEEIRGELQKAVDLAVGWQNYAKHLESGGRGGQTPPQVQQGQQGQAGQAGQQGASAPAPEPKKFSELLNNDALDFLSRNAGTPAAMQYLAQHIDGFVQEQVQRGIDTYKAELAPLLQQIQGFQTDQATITAATSYFMNAARLTDEEGNLLYPELSQNVGAAREITSLWKQLPPDLAYSPDGIAYAYFKWQQMSGGGLGQQSRAAIPGQGPNAQPQNGGVQFPEPEDVVVTLDGDGSPRPVEQLTRQQRAAREALAVFRAGRQGSDMDENFLGVSR